METVPDRVHLKSIASVFSPVAIRAMAESLRCRRLRQVASKARLDSNSYDSIGSLVDQLYRILSAHYRCEYVYKNTLAKKIVSGRHRPHSIAMTTELYCDTSKADLAVFNGTSCVYEIKTELDSLDRLPRQLASYRRVFDKISVVTCEDMVDKVSKLAGDDVGILVLTSRTTLRTIRDSASHADFWNSGCMFDLLRAGEYIEIIERHFGPMPSVPNTLRYTFFKERFLQLSVDVAHNEMARALQRRFRPNIDNSLIGHMPKSLTAICLDSRFNLKQLNRLAQLMRLPYAPA